MHGEGATHGHAVAQPGHALGGGDADALLTLAAVELRALARGVAQGDQHGGGRRQQPVFARCRRELAEPGTQGEASGHVAGHQSVVFECAGEAVCGGARKSGGVD